METQRNTNDLSSKEKTLNSKRLNQVKHLFFNKANELCPGFVVDQENRKIIELLLMYCIQHPGFLSEPQLFRPSFEKSILLAGNIGAGKTLLLEILRACRFPQFAGRFLYCHQVVADVRSEGDIIIKNLGRNCLNVGSNPIKAAIFDDLGSENKISNYGVLTDVMEEILNDRYILSRRNQLFTHLTTNLAKEDIEDRYGSRVLSRLYEMCNILTLGGEESSTDRRRHERTKAEKTNP